MASDDLRARIRRACAEADGFTFDSLEPHDYQQHADKILAVLEQSQQLNDDAWGGMWLHGKWSWLTKCMTTPEREHAADCVARWSARLNADDPDLEPGEPEGLRWWREPAKPLRAELPLTAFMGVEQPIERESTETVLGGRRLTRGPYPKPAHGATIASDRCPSCGGDNTDPWADCPRCQTNAEESPS